MIHISRFKKKVILFSLLKLWPLGMLPLQILWSIYRSFKNEKVTKVSNQYVINTFFPPFPSPASIRAAWSVLNIYRRRNVLFSAHLSLTDNCGFSCWHCSNAYRNGQELSSGQWLKAIAALDDLGCAIIGFTGGEPLRREDLDELIKAAAKSCATVLYTSGEGLSVQRAKELKRAGLTYVAISLDHFDCAEHNRLRGSSAAFSTACAAIKNARLADFYTAAQLTLRKNSCDLIFLQGYLDFVSRLGVQEIRVIEPMPAGKLSEAAEDLFFEEKDRSCLKYFQQKVNGDPSLPKITLLSDIEDESLCGCSAGKYHVYIDAAGNVSPCDFIPLSFGNILEEPPPGILKRLKFYFPYSQKTCFARQNSKLLKTFFHGRQPPEQSIQESICEDFFHNLLQ